MTDRPSMKQDQHPDHNMPPSEHDGIDLGVDVSSGDEGPYNLMSAFSNARRDQDLQEKVAGTRFHDDGERIPGRIKGLNDRNLDRPAALYPLAGGR